MTLNLLRCRFINHGLLELKKSSPFLTLRLSLNTSIVSKGSSKVRICDIKQVLWLKKRNIFNNNILNCDFFLLVSILFGNYSLLIILSNAFNYIVQYFYIITGPNLKIVLMCTSIKNITLHILFIHYVICNVTIECAWHLIDSSSINRETFFR